MALKIKPPTHRSDALGIFISAHDPAWDDDRYKADVEVMVAAALKAKQDAAEAAYMAILPEHRPTNPDDLAAQIKFRRTIAQLTEDERHKARAAHPVVRYLAGLTRWQPGAQDWDPTGKPCTVRDYLKPNAAPSEFTIRRLSYQAYQAADEITSTAERLTAFARASLRAIKSPEWNWTAADHETRAPDEVLQALHDADPSLPLQIGQAVISLCRPLSDTEVFR
jgi:hypothetical protein